MPKFRLFEDSPKDSTVYLKLLPHVNNEVRLVAVDHAGIPIPGATILSLDEDGCVHLWPAVDLGSINKDYYGCIQVVHPAVQQTINPIADGV